MKKCLICEKEFLHINNRQKFCSKKCRDIDVKDYQKQYKRKYRQTKKWKKYIKEYRTREVYRESRKRYRKSYKGKISQRRYERKHGKTPLGIASIYRRHQNRRAAKHNIIELFTETEWQNKLESTNGFCPGFEIKKHYVGIANLKRDHIYSITRAHNDFLRTGVKRKYYIKDMQPLCQSCNSRKRDKIVEGIIK